VLNFNTFIRHQLLHGSGWWCTDSKNSTVFSWFMLCRHIDRMRSKRARKCTRMPHFHSKNKKKCSREGHSASPYPLLWGKETPSMGRGNPLPMTPPPYGLWPLDRPPLLKSWILVQQRGCGLAAVHLKNLFMKGSSERPLNANMNAPY